MGHKLKLLCCLMGGSVPFFVLGLVLGLVVDWTSNSGDEFDPSISPLEYFNKTDSLDITWYHGSNSQASLEEALRGQYNMLEGDIQLRWAGHQNQTDEPIMAHPPDVDSDLTVMMYVEAIIARNDKGMKMDFKSLEAVTPCLELLQEKGADVRNPVWANADVVKGPGSTSDPIDPQQFLAMVNDIYPKVTLSLGWTTGCCDELYTRDMMENMWNVCKETSQPISLPTRAALFWPSWEHLRWLLLQDEGRFSITVWTPRGVLDWEGATPYDLVRVRNDCKTTYIYYDLPGTRFDDFKRLSITAGTPINAYSSLDWDAANANLAAHINSESELDEALTDVAIHLLQGDVHMNDKSTPVMGNAGDKPELTLEKWISETIVTTKGMLLMLRENSEIMIREALIIVHSFHGQYRQPMWLGADLFPGPNYNVNIPNTSLVDSDLFNSTLQLHFPESSLVLGWGTGERSSNESLNQYTPQMIQQMSEFAKTLRQPVLFSVRLTYARASWEALTSLLEESRAYQMILHAGADEEIDSEDIEYIREHSEHHRVYYMHDN